MIGWILEKYCIVSSVTDDKIKYDYTLPMIIFASLGVIAMLFAIWLKREDKTKSYGLEEPNIKG